jgi:hypothetical protein
MKRKLGKSSGYNLSNKEVKAAILDMLNTMLPRLCNILFIIFHCTRYPFKQTSITVTNVTNKYNTFCQGFNQYWTPGMLNALPQRCDSIFHQMKFHLELIHCNVNVTQFVKPFISRYTGNLILFATIIYKQKCKNHKAFTLLTKFNKIFQAVVPK